VPGAVPFEVFTTDETTTVGAPGLSGVRVSSVVTRSAVAGVGVTRYW
jgi:hypothetical protein